jgi:hypothetical protein
MSKGQWAFRPAVLTRAIKAAEKAGKSRAPTLAGSAVMAEAGPFPRSIGQVVEKPPRAPKLRGA